MSKVKVSRRGPVGNAGRVTLSHLRAGETFRFPRSAPGTVYQLLTIPNRSIDDDFDGVDAFMFANVATGQVYVADDSEVVALLAGEGGAVVPVDCSLTVRERVIVEKPQRNTRASSTRSTRSSTSVRATKRRSRR
jgi:hypothetical protein